MRATALKLDPVFLPRQPFERRLYGELFVVLRLLRRPRCIKIRLIIVPGNRPSMMIIIIIIVMNIIVINIIVMSMIIVIMMSKYLCGLSNSFIIGFLILFVVIFS